MKETIPKVVTDEGENDRISKEELIEVSKAISELSEASPLSTEKEILQELKEDREDYKEVNGCTCMCMHTCYDRSLLVTVYKYLHFRNVVCSF